MATAPLFVETNRNYIPVPVNLVVNGLNRSAAKVLILPVCVPVVVGVKVTLMVQLPLAGTLVPQVLVCANGPLIEMLPMVTGEGVELLTVNTLGALVVPTFVEGNVKDAGLNESAEDVPVRFTTCGLPGWLVVM